MKYTYTIDTVYPDRFSNENLILMFKIINYRLNNLLEYKLPKFRSDEYIEIERHHIIPGSWYKLHKCKIDNSKDNLIFVTLIEHIKIHILLKKYFNDVGNIEMEHAMALAISILCNNDKEKINKLLLLDDDSSFLLNELALNKIHARKAISFKYTLERRRAAAERIRKLNSTFIGKNNPMYKLSVVDHMSPDKVKLWRYHMKHKKFKNGKRSSTDGKLACVNIFSKQIKMIEKENISTFIRSNNNEYIKACVKSRLIHLPMIIFLYKIYLLFSHLRNYIEIEKIINENKNTLQVSRKIKALIKHNYVMLNNNSIKISDYGYKLLIYLFDIHKL